MKRKPNINRLSVASHAGISICLLLSFSPNIIHADALTSSHALAIVGKYQGVSTSVPTQSNTQETTDAPLMGNGDLGVSVQGNINAMVFILGKNEFWSLNDGSVRAMARLSLSIPSMSGASYSMAENLLTGEVNGTFGLSGNTLGTKSWVQADNTVNNMLITQFTYTGTGTKAVSVSLAVGNQNNYGNTIGSSGDVLYIDVKGDNADMVGNYATCKVRVATRVLGVAGTVTNNTLNFTVAPGTTYTLITSIMSNYDNANYQTQTVGSVTAATPNTIDSLNTSHHSWWSNFYGKSFVEIPNKTLEKEYYGSLYLLASCSRTGEAPPGLWGNWVMENPAWNSDYTLNYNYEAPFYAAFPTNHPELADSYDKPVIDWVPSAQSLAKQRGWTGAYYRVHIGPLPNGSADNSEHNQKSIGAFAATDMLMHYYYTHDLTYAQKIYPTIQQMSVFYQNYLTWDGTRYVDNNDAQQEDDPDPQTNGIMSLGLIRFLLQGAIDINTALNQDTAQRAIWQNRLTNLSAFPTFMRNGVEVFRWTEVGDDWVNGNAIGSQHIYPASQIGLSSDPNLLQIAKNMIDQMARWSDGNGTVTFYPAAARVGYNSTTILNQMNSWVQNNAFPNLHIHTGGGGVENLNTVPSGLCEMLLQTFQDTARFFSDWPSGTDAKFGDLLGYGGYLLSSDIRSNVVQYVRIISQKGGPFNLFNPWPGTTLQVYRNGNDAGTVSGNKITLTTDSGETIHLAPSGTSLSTILTRMNVSLDGTSLGIISGNNQIRQTGVDLGIAKSVYFKALDQKISFIAKNANNDTRSISVRIYTRNGALVKALKANGNAVDWNFADYKNSSVAVGGYVYTIKLERTNQTATKSGIFQVLP